MKSDKIVFTGMRPTGKLHLGHYLGVIENMGFKMNIIATILLQTGMLLLQNTIKRKA